MAGIVRAALVQTNWTGDQESMTKAHEEYARQAAAAGAQVICFQELFYGPTSASSRTPSSTSTPNRSPARPSSGSVRWRPNSAW
jgi:predicted amidohydrolase